ncbi:MAG: gas vesicle protein GvpK [Candidatus Nanopelagicales bacterium]
MIDVEEDDLRRGLLGLVFALVDIIQEVLANTALDRVEKGSLDDDEIERLGNAMADIEEALAELKEEMGVTKSAADIRVQLDDLVNDLLNTLVNPREVNSGPEGHAINLG